jgi:hypothetical protein
MAFEIGDRVALIHPGNCDVLGTVWDQANNVRVIVRWDNPEEQADVKADRLRPTDRPVQLWRAQPEPAHPNSHEARAFPIRTSSRNCLGSIPSFAARSLIACASSSCFGGPVTDPAKGASLAVPYPITRVRDF